jgi:drug/metabolite transporter (DMT)-like permease
MVRASLPGGLLFGLNIVLFFSALKRTNVADVLIIQSLQPALTLLVAGRLFGERVTGQEIRWTAVSVMGVTLVAVGSSGTPAWSLTGDLFAAGSLLVWTSYFLVSKRVRRNVQAVEYLTAVTIIASLVVTPTALLSGEPLGGFRSADWMWLGLFLAGAQGGHLLVAWAHGQVDVSVSSLLILGEPIISAVAALIFLAEPLTPLEILGGVLVLGAMAAVVRRATRAGAADAEPEPPPS